VVYILGFIIKTILLPPLTTCFQMSITFFLWNIGRYQKSMLDTKIFPNEKKKNSPHFVCFSPKFYFWSSIGKFM
jgi:hypothetical protein